MDGTAIKIDWRAANRDAGRSEKSFFHFRQDDTILHDSKQHKN
jgi:hypothetical protein